MYRVIAGNIGTVYAGRNQSDAMLAFCNCVADSKNNTGKCASESVDLFTDDELTREHIGRNDL